MIDNEHNYERQHKLRITIKMTNGSRQIEEKLKAKLIYTSLKVYEQKNIIFSLESEWRILEMLTIITKLSPFRWWAIQ